MFLQKIVAFLVFAAFHLFNHFECRNKVSMDQSRTINLLQNIYYGDEIEDRAAATQWLAHFFADLAPEQINRIYDAVFEYFRPWYDGVFGGQITAGDALFVAAMMERVRPNRMIEIGVASGYSSAFIIFYAERIGLLGSGIFLYSYDLFRQTPDGHETGSFFQKHYSQYLQSWSLSCEVTAADLLAGRALAPDISDGAVLAFIDGGHNHPWPTVDVYWLSKICKPGTWVVMQDIQMMERWIADCIRFNVISPRPIRGVNLAFALWPGAKIVGHDLCYNCGAIQLFGESEELHTFVESSLVYPFEVSSLFETKFEELDLLKPKARRVE